MTNLEKKFSEKTIDSGHLNLKWFNPRLLHAFNRHTNHFAAYPLLSDNTQMDLHPIRSSVSTFRRLIEMPQQEAPLDSNAHSSTQSQTKEDYVNSVSEYLKMENFSFSYPRLDERDNENDDICLSPRISKYSFDNLNDSAASDTSISIIQDLPLPLPPTPSKPRHSLTINAIKSRLSLKNKQSPLSHPPPLPPPSPHRAFISVLNSTPENYLDFESVIFKKKLQLSNQAIGDFYHISSLDEAYSFMNTYGTDFIACKHFLLGSQTLTTLELSSYKLHTSHLQMLGCHILDRELEDEDKLVYPYYATYAHVSPSSIDTLIFDTKLEKWVSQVRMERVVESYVTSFACDDDEDEDDDNILTHDLPHHMINMNVISRGVSFEMESMCDCSKKLDNSKSETRKDIVNKWVSVCEMIKAAEFFDKNENQECMRLLEHAYLVRKRFVDFREIACAKLKEKGLLRDNVNFDCERYWNDSVWPHMRLHMDNLTQLITNENENENEQNYQFYRNLYERAYYTCELALKGGFYLLNKKVHFPQASIVEFLNPKEAQPIERNIPYFMRIFIYFSQEVIEKNWLKLGDDDEEEAEVEYRRTFRDIGGLWGRVLESALHIAKLERSNDDENDERQTSLFPVQIYLVDYNMHSMLIVSKNLPQQKSSCSKTSQAISPVTSATSLLNDKDIEIKYKIHDPTVYWRDELKLERDTRYLDMSSRHRLAFDDIKRQHSHLTHLNLSRNFLVKLNELTFTFSPIFQSKYERFKHLTHLSLERNHLHDIHEKTFDSLTSLIHLNLSYNFLKCNMKRLFANNKQLRQLSVSHNCIRRVSVNAFDELNELQFLDLSFNVITQLNDRDNLFMNENLEEASLAHQIDPQEACSFDKLLNLEVLNLNNNCLKSLHKNQFFYNHRLEKLNLSYNKLSQLDAITEGNDNEDWSDGIFGQLRNLEILNLSYNKLTRLPTLFNRDENLSYFQALKALCVQHNDLISLDYDDLCDLRRLKILFAHGNKISRLRCSSFRDLSKIRIIFLYENNNDNLSQFCVELKKQHKHLSHLLVNHDLSKIRELIMLIQLKKYRNLIENETFQLRK